MKESKIGNVHLFHSSRCFLPLQLFRSLCSAGGILASKFGIRRNFGLYDDNKALYGKVYFYYLWELPIYAVMGVFGGCMGSLYIKLQIFVSRLRGRYIPVAKRKRRIAEVAVPPHLPAPSLFVSSIASCQRFPAQACPQGSLGW